MIGFTSHHPHNTQAYHSHMKTNWLVIHQTDNYQLLYMRLGPCMRIRNVADDKEVFLQGGDVLEVESEFESLERTWPDNKEKFDEFFDVYCSQYDDIMEVSE